MTILCAVCMDKGIRTVLNADPEDNIGRPTGICGECADHLLNIQFLPKRRLNKRRKIPVEDRCKVCEGCGNLCGVFKVITLTKNKVTEDDRFCIHACETLCGRCAAERTDGMIPVGETGGMN